MKNVFLNISQKHLCQSFFFNKVAGLRSATLLKKRLWHRCFPVNFAKFLGRPFLQNTSCGCFSILMQLQDFNYIKYRRGMKTVSFCLSKKIIDIWKQPLGAILWKRSSEVRFCLRIGVFWIVQSRGALNKIRCSFKILPFCVGCWRDLNYNWRANSKHPG